MTRGLILDLKISSDTGGIWWYSDLEFYDGLWSWELKWWHGNMTWWYCDIEIWKKRMLHHVHWSLELFQSNTERTKDSSIFYNHSRCQTKQMSSKTCLGTLSYFTNLQLAAIKCHKRGWFPYNSPSSMAFGRWWLGRWFQWHQTCHNFPQVLGSLQTQQENNTADNMTIHPTKSHTIWLYIYIYI